MKINKKITMILIFIAILIIPYISLAADLDTSKYNGIYTMPSGSDRITDLGGLVLGIIQTVGTIISVLMLTIVGIKYVTANSAEKAQLKEKLVPVVIGAILLFGGSNLFSIIADYARTKIK